MKYVGVLVAGLVLTGGGFPAQAADDVIVTAEAESRERRSTVHEVVVPATLEAVWQAVSTADGWADWASPRAWWSPGEPQVIETSYDPAATPGGASTIKNEITDAVPRRSLTFRTIKAPDGFGHFSDLAKVTWRFDLIPEGPERTRVRLTGSGYPATSGGDEVLGFFRRGNSVSLGNLRTRFVTGPIDWKAELGKVTTAPRQ